MGYNTRYKLHCLPAQDPDFYGDVSLNDCYLRDYTEGETLFGESCKWYEHDTQMRRLSVYHPSIVFILDGEGEEAGDIWRKFYKNGRSYTWVPDIDPPPYDHSQLV